MLYHSSEESGIDVFVPREKSIRRDMPPVVWAIDATHEVVSERTVVPVKVVALDGLLERFVDAGLELRVTPSPHPLRDALLATESRASGIHRFEFAGPAKGDWRIASKALWGYLESIGSRSWAGSLFILHGEVGNGNENVE